MNTRVALDAFLGFLITFGGSMLVLFSQPNVAQFSDITPVSYAVAVLTAMIAAAKLIQSRLADSPTNVSQTNDIVTAAANLDVVTKQSGYARPADLLLLVYLVAVFFAVGSVLSGCTTNPPQTTRQGLLAAYESAEWAASQIEMAKRDGYIDAAKRDELIGSVKQARDLLNATRVALANSPDAGSTNESAAAENLRAAQTILLAIQAALPKEKTP